MPRISIIVPVYKAQLVLDRCVKSVLHQTYTDFELILVDDGSPDNSGTMCDEYASQDDRICVVHQENSGVSAARNAGLDVAAGEYVAFVDSDDYVAETYISSLLESQSDLVIGGMQVQDEHGCVLYTKKYTQMRFAQRQEIDFPCLYRNNMLYSPYCKLFRNNIIRREHLRFPDGITWGEDGMFVADYLQYIHSLSVTTSVGYFYIKYDRDDSLSTKVREDIVDMIVCSREYCIQKMRITSPQNYRSVQMICENDIRHNCAYFVGKLLKNTNTTKKAKEKILDRFMRSPYVVETMNTPDVYYKWNSALHPLFQEKNAKKIVRKAEWRRKWRRILGWAYSVYERQPSSVKKFYRIIKRKAKK